MDRDQPTPMKKINVDCMSELLSCFCVQRPPYMTINNTASRQEDVYSGFCLALVKELALALNFRSAFTSADSFRNTYTFLECAK